MALVARNASHAALAGANGTWFLLTVAAQSAVVGLTALPSPTPTGVVAVAVACWATGVIFYLLTTGW